MEAVALSFQPFSVGGFGFQTAKRKMTFLPRTLRECGVELKGIQGLTRKSFCPCDAAAADDDGRGAVVAEGLDFRIADM